MALIASTCDEDPAGPDLGDVAGGYILVASDGTPPPVAIDLCGVFPDAERCAGILVSGVLFLTVEAEFNVTMLIGPLEPSIPVEIEGSFRFEDSGEIELVTEVATFDGEFDRNAEACEGFQPFDADGVTISLGEGVSVLFCEGATL